VNGNPLSALMPRRLFTVSDTFLIRGRGLVLVPGIVPVDDERFRAGDPLPLKRPDGTALRTTITNFEIMNPNPRREVVVCLKELTKEDVPIGTEVWSIAGGVR
jgi:hypothetical protein